MTKKPTVNVSTRANKYVVLTVTPDTELVLTREEALALAQQIENWAEDLPAPRVPRQKHDSGLEAMRDYYDRVAQTLAAQTVVPFTTGKPLVWRRSTDADQEGTTP